MADAKVPYKKLLLQLAVFYSYDMPDVQLRQFADFLADRITVDELADAIRVYCEDPKNEFFPRPVSKLVALARPQMSDEDVGRDVAARILSAVRRHGRYNWEDASKSIGEVGAAAVRRLGGWGAVCDMANEGHLTNLQAQLRDLAKTVNAVARAGISDVPPALPRRHSVMKELGQRQAVAGLIQNLASEKSIPVPQKRKDSK